MGLTGNPGLSVGALINPNTTSSAHIPQIDSSRTEGSGSESPGIIRQAGCPSDLSQRYCRFHKFFVCGAQEGWRKPPSCKFETSQPISGVRTLQNGRYSHVERPSKTGRLSGQDRSQGCIFDRSNLERSSKFFTFSMERSIARVCLPSVWLATAPRVFTKLMKPVVAMLRQRGVRLIIYLDDMLIMAESTSLALHHAASALNLLESLGFVVNYHKSQLIRSQQIEFLGFLVDSVTLSLQLPGEKLRKIRKRCQQLLNVGETSIRELSKFFNSSSFPSPSALQTSAEIEKSHPEHPTVLRCNNSSRLSSEGRTSLVARPSPSVEWQSSVPKVCRPSNRNRCFTQGLGGYYEGVSTGGPWCSNEQRLHINSLELLAGSFAIKTFCKNRVVAHVKLLMDNVSAVTYINKMGGTHSQTLANLAIDLWNWCLDRKIDVSAEHLPGVLNLRAAEHLPGVLNLRADRESRVITDSSDWKLNPASSKILVQKWGPLQVDLFASRLTFQLPRFVSWKPKPYATATDAFLMNWGYIRGYAFPPFALTGRCLQQVMTQNVDHLVLVAPIWPAQPWYSVLLHLAVDKPLLLSVTPELLLKDNQAHPLTNLQPTETRDILLAAWRRNTSSAYSCA